MKKLTTLMASMLLFTAFASSQVLEDFEHIPMNWFSLGENGFVQVVANPDPEGNTGHYVGEFTRGQGDPWGGFWSPLPEPLDMDQYSYIFVDVWKPRISPVVIKLEQGPDPDIELPSVDPQTTTEEWETLVFDFSEVEGQWNVLTFFPDFIDPVDLDEDIMIYFDNIILSDNPVPGEGNELVVESFNFIHMNPMLGGEEDDSHFTIIPNPDQGNANPSNYVVRFHRSQHGVPWGGFWAPLPEPVDMSEHKYVYVDVWKPRISPIRFKVEGGPGGTFEHESIDPQTKVGEWETMVFHFPDADGEYPIIAFLPDFEDPLELDEDIVIFFDNIRVGDAPGDDDDNGNGLADFDFIWCDFEDEFTNVGGFREVINAATTATDIDGGGFDGGTALELQYDLSGDATFTGYQMWSFPDKIDVSEYNFFAIRIKAEQSIENATIVLRDDVEVNGRSFHTFDIGTEWHNVFLPLDDFELLEGFDNEADLTIMHLIQVAFEEGVVSEAQGTVHIDLVGFTHDMDVSVSDFVFSANQINVFPNPATQRVHVTASVGAIVSLFDVTGRLVSQKSASSETVTINLQGLSEGMYIIRVNQNGQTSSRKLMVY